MKENILLVEDEEGLRMTLGDRLRSEGYVVDLACDGREGFEKANTLAFDLIILDIMLPQRSGLDVCRDLRNLGVTTPILMLTARNLTIDKVLGIKLGADDYVTKPFDSLELMARVEALLRRAPVRNNPAIYEIGGIRMDVRGTEVTRDGEPVSLSAREFQLLRYFMEHPGETLSRSDLLRSVWGYEDGAFTRTVDVHIANLRQKVENDPKRPELILTVTGIGYKLRA